MNRSTPQKNILLTFVFGLLSLAWLGVTNLSFVPLNSAATILNPIHGIWRFASDDWPQRKPPVDLDGIGRKVSAIFDQQRVPHLFATSDEDIYAAQGFVVASQRLWQMEFMARLASGRLSEILGSKTLIIDQTFVKLGIPQAALDSWDFMQHDSRTKAALEAYSRGVNSYIAGLQPNQYPFEYKLFGLTPQKWEPIHSVLIMKFMAFMLAGHSQDLKLTRSRARISDADFDQLFPLFLPGAEAIIPSATAWPFPSLSPKAPTELFRATVDVQPTGPQPHPDNGSNNWAVSGKKSTTGLPILSNDVHLDYGLPALWYQMQLVSQNQNVMGATLPGTPGVVLGFNRQVAWAVTNGGTDVMDWYELRYRDPKKLEYLHEGQWRPILTRDHELKIRGQSSLMVQLKQTHFGPIPFEENDQPLMSHYPKGLALRWAVLDPSNEIKVFLDLNHAKSFDECVQALALHSTPDQNFICADSEDHIGILHQGKYPIRFPGQGRLIGDGSDADYDWKGWIPQTQIPKSIDPVEGFVGSANQEPVAPSYPHALIGFRGGQFELPYRASRIYELLRAKEKLSPEDFMNMQADKYNALAAKLSPTFVDLAEKQIQLQANEPDQLARERQQLLSILQQLKAWDFKHENDSLAATVWDVWWREFETLLWSDKFPDRQRFLFPSEPVTANLVLSLPDSVWFDRLATDKIETLPQLLTESLRTTLHKLVLLFGEDIQTWRWGRYQPVQIQHLTKLPGLGKKPFAAGGSAFSVMANSGRHGPSWSAIVALDADRPKAWSIQPGGQSGDPRSFYYDNLISDWAQTKLREVTFWLDVSDVEIHKKDQVQLRFDLLPVSAGEK